MRVTLVLTHQGAPPLARPNNPTTQQTTPILMNNTPKTKPTPASPAQTPISYLTKLDRDGSICPQDLQRAKQAFGVEHDNEVALRQHWCGNTSILEQSGPIGAVVTSNTVDVQPWGPLISPYPQLQIVGESRGFQSLMNELVQSQTLGLVHAEYLPGQWVGGLWLRGRTRSVMLCFNPLSAMTRGLIQRWQDSGKVSVLFANPLEGMRSEEYDLREAETPARMLALPIPAAYVPDVAHTWEGMHYIAARHKDPKTLYLTTLEETAVAAMSARH